VTKLKRHLSVANVLSCIALFVALGGAAYAAAKIPPNAVKARNIARQAVTSAKIKREAVTSGKIKNGTINALDIGAGQVTSEKIATGAVTGKKIAKKAVSPRTIAEEAVSTGKLGNEAVTSGKISSSVWKQLLKNVTYVTETSGPQSEATKTVVAKCPSGKEVLGGGVRITGSSKVVPTESAPEFDAAGARVGWSASAKELEDEPGTWTILAYAVCAEL
jgi:hypothetical protein